MASQMPSSTRPSAAGCAAGAVHGPAPRGPARAPSAARPRRSPSRSSGCSSGSVSPVPLGSCPCAQSRSSASRAAPTSSRSPTSPTRPLPARWDPGGVAGVNRADLLQRRATTRRLGVRRRGPAWSSAARDAGGGRRASRLGRATRCARCCPAGATPSGSACPGQVLPVPDRRVARRRGGPPRGGVTPCGPTCS